MAVQKNNSKHLATISLIIMAAGFLLTLPLNPSTWKTVLQGGFEAGLVGGLADWFAVTALFRHPMGLPIPHTALLPKNRTKIIDKIISMLENDWLTMESIRAKINTFQFSEKLFSLINREIQSPAAKVNTVAVIKQLIGKVNVKKFAPFLEKELKSQLQNFQLQSILPVLLDQIKSRKYDEKSLDFVLNEVDEWAKKDSTKYRLGGMAVGMIENIKADGIMQFALRSFSNLINEEKLGNIIQNLILKGIDSFRDPINPNRQNLLYHIQQKLEGLKTDEKLYIELELLKTNIISNWDGEQRIVDFLSQTQQKIISYVENENFYEEFILPLFQDSIKGITNDKEKMEKLEGWLKEHISSFVEKNHSKIGNLVRENLDKLETKTLIHMIETNVGKDLQWIRVNGAVCGFLIGLVLSVIKIIF
ncbi:DUF445 domain-containing protein [Neobacillus dielmonensis]|uniref:DUF445 domain-containing protein n=1 Tax=Neobacillus dielmonensis TaxID=1347369 RepID=UPI0005A8F9B4|nr:DUF445 domain-containing protein [Neobacillus dielmonensis]